MGCKVVGSLDCVNLACFRFADRSISLMVEAGFWPSLMVHKQSGRFGKVFLCWLLSI